MPKKEKKAIPVEAPAVNPQPPEMVKVMTEVYKTQSVKMLDGSGRYAIGEDNVEVINFWEEKLQVKIAYENGEALSYAGIPFVATMKKEKVEIEVPEDKADQAGFERVK